MSAAWTIEILNDYLDDRLSPSARAQLESALREQIEAAEALRELENVRDQLREAPRYCLTPDFASNVVARLSTASAAGAGRWNESSVSIQSNTQSYGLTDRSWRMAAAAITVLAASLLLIVFVNPWRIPAEVAQNPAADSRAANPAPAPNDPQLGDEAHKLNMGRALVERNDDFNALTERETFDSEAAKSIDSRGGGGLTSESEAPPASPERTQSMTEQRDELAQTPAPGGTTKERELADAESDKLEVRSDAREEMQIEPVRPMVEAGEGKKLADELAETDLQIVEITTTAANYATARGFVSSSGNRSNAGLPDAAAAPDSQFQFKRSEIPSADDVDNAVDPADRESMSRSRNPPESSNQPALDTQYVLVETTPGQMNLLLEKLGGSQSVIVADQTRFFAEPALGDQPMTTGRGGEIAGLAADGRSSGELRAVESATDLVQEKSPQKPDEMNSQTATIENGKLVWQELSRSDADGYFQQVERLRKSKDEIGENGQPPDSTESKLEPMNRLLTDSSDQIRRYLLILQIVENPVAPPAAEPSDQ